MPAVKSGQLLAKTHFQNVTHSTPQEHSPWFLQSIYRAISSASLFWAGFSLIDSTLWNQKRNYTYKGSILAIQCSSVVEKSETQPNEISVV